MDIYEPHFFVLRRWNWFFKTQARPIDWYHFLPTLIFPGQYLKVDNLNIPNFLLTITAVNEIILKRPVSDYCAFWKVSINFIEMAGV